MNTRDHFAVFCVTKTGLKPYGASQAADKRAVGRVAVTKPGFVYVIYIRSTPDQVWKGLLEPEFTRQYWMHDNVSDWQVGSSWEHVRSDGGDKKDIVGEVLESDAPRRLVLSWARPKDLGNDERTSRLTFELEEVKEWPHGPWVSLTLTHDDLDKEMLESVSFGWPATMSGLKTLLESGF